MIAACRVARVPLWVGYYRRALPRFLKVRSLIEDGAIGEVRLVVSRQLQRLLALVPGELPWRINPALSGGGFFFEAACHTFDFLDFLFGPIRKVRAFVGNQAGAWPAEDVVAATYPFHSGVLESRSWCYTADTDEEMNEVVGAKGRIQFSPASRCPSAWSGARQWKRSRWAIRRRCISR